MQGPAHHYCSKRSALRRASKTILATICSVQCTVSLYLFLASNLHEWHPTAARHLVCHSVGYESIPIAHQSSHLCSNSIFFATSMPCRARAAAIVFRGQPQLSAAAAPARRLPVVRVLAVCNWHILRQEPQYVHDLSQTAHHSLHLGLRLPPCLMLAAVGGAASICRMASGASTQFRMIRLKIRLGRARGQGPAAATPAGRSSGQPATSARATATAERGRQLRRRPGRRRGGPECAAAAAGRHAPPASAPTRSAAAD